MDLTGFASYILSGLTLFAGIVIFFGENEYIVPASGRSLRLPCSFLFWFLALIFWAMAVKVEDDDTII
ncbi:MAG: hypothetical protein VX129_02730 [Candidatus Thermoplasmatota archaeon]|nr:hypothetical protein [Candidatus Thermoplasmatota archaeon]